MRIVVAYPPGGSTDAIMRLVQPGLQQRLGHPIVIENRSGASGSVGTAAVVKSPPDGNTWLAVFDNHAANPFVLPTLPLRHREGSDPVLLIGLRPVITTAAAKPYKTLADGDRLRQGQSWQSELRLRRSGSVGHLAMALLSQRAGVKLTHVPYRGGGRR
jgi:tripartite-type tricarboxylate transporter receptor subunit TctC